jgi:anti-sigma-K factor RskA
VDVHELTPAYALHALDAEEREAFEAHLAQCERCREELAMLNESAAALAWAVESPAPPPALRARILAGAAEGRENVVPLRRRERRWRGVAAIAACVAVGLGVFAATEHNSLTSERAHASALQIVADPTSRKLPLQGANGMVAIAPNGEGVLVVEHLPAAPSGKTYEAWVVMNGTAHRAGTFEGGSGMSMLKLGMQVPRGAVIAATVERDGGVDSPTQKPFVSAQA